MGEPWTWDVGDEIPAAVVEVTDVGGVRWERLDVYWFEVLTDLEGEHPGVAPNLLTEDALLRTYGPVHWPGRPRAWRPES